MIFSHLSPHFHFQIKIIIIIVTILNDTNCPQHLQVNYFRNNIGKTSFINIMMYSFQILTVAVVGADAMLYRPAEKGGDRPRGTANGIEMSVLKSRSDADDVTTPKPMEPTEHVGVGDADTPKPTALPCPNFMLSGNEEEDANVRRLWNDSCFTDEDRLALVARYNERNKWFMEARRQANQNKLAKP